MSTIRVKWEGAGATIARFRVKPIPDRSWYYEVVVFPNRDSMRKYHRKKVGILHPLGRAAACCHTLDILRNVGGRWRRSPKIGELHFTRRCMTMRIVTHESVHAGVGAMVRARVDLSDLTRPPKGCEQLAYDGPEEQLCRAVHHVATQVVSVGRKAGWC